VGSSPGRCIPDCSLLEVVLIEHAHAVRAFLAVAERVQPVAVAQDQAQTSRLAARKRGEQGRDETSFEHALFLVQPITVTPYFSNCSSVVTTVKSCSLATAMMNRSHGSLWIGGSWAAAMQAFNSSGRTASP